MPKHTSLSVLLSALALNLLLLSGCVWLEGANVPSSQTNTQRTGVYHTKGVRSSPRVAWKFKTGGELRSSPAIAGGMVYFGSDDEHLYALNASDGGLRWKLKTGGRVRSSPIVQDGIVCVGSDDGALYAAEAGTGVEKWKAKTYGYFILLDRQGVCCEDYLKANLPPPRINYYMEVYVTSGWGIYASPVITGNHAYFGAEGAYFYAADLATGEIAWVSATPSNVTSTAAADGNALYIVTDMGTLFSIDPVSQDENWRFYTMRGFRDSSVVVANGTIYLSGWAIDASTGEEKWRFTENGGTTDPLVSGDRVYFTAGRHVHAANAHVGNELWEFDTGGDILTAPALADGLLYVSSHEGHLHAIDANTGKGLWRFKAESAITTAPAIADGMVYFGCEDGFLYALR